MFSKFNLEVKVTQKSRQPGSFKRYWISGSARIMRFGELGAFKAMREDK
jgi:hypothetical protein